MDQRHSEQTTPQETQHRFDTSHGLKDLPFEPGYLNASRGASPEEQRETLLRQLEFATSAAAGEAGELIGVIKKWRRSIALRSPVDPPLQDIHGEMADVYAYLLKVANILGRDLDQIYFEKVARNFLRFSPRPQKDATAKAVSVIGAPGTGKTSAVKLVGHHLGAETTTYIEEYEHNTDLWKARSDRRAQDTSQLWFLDGYRRFFDGVGGSDIVLDQDPSAVVLVYSSQFRDEGGLQDDAYTKHLRQLIALEDRMAVRWDRRLLIHLCAEPSTLAKRCIWKKPNLSVDQRWLEEVSDRFTRVYENANVIKRIDTTYLTEEEVGAEVLAICRDQLQGKHV